MILILLIIGSLFFIHFKLSKKNNKYLGLIIPIIIFISSIILCVSFSGIIKDKYIIKTTNGEKYTYFTESEAKVKLDELTALHVEMNTKFISYPRREINSIVIYFVLINVISTIFLLIYYYIKKISRAR
jgi:hypothetical protein